MTFSHLMTPEQVQTVLDSRIEDAERNLRLIDDFEQSCIEECTAGIRFTLEFGRTMLRTMKEFVEQNRDMFAEDCAPPKKSATG